MVVKIQAEVSGVVIPCNVVVGYQRFGGPCCICLHPTTTLHGHTTQIPWSSHFTLKMEAASSSETLVSYHNTYTASQSRRPRTEYREIWRYISLLYVLL